MPSITCRQNGTAHTHTSIEDVKVCQGIMAPPRIEPVRPYTYHDPATAKQINFIRDLGGDVDKARTMSKSEASAYITDLKKRPRPVTTPTTSLDTGAVRESKIRPMLPLLEHVPDGYYAVTPDATVAHTFLRVSRPVRGNFKGCLKIQTQHGPNWDIAWVLYPNGRIATYKASIEESILLTIADYKGAARQYARELGRCCRCNTELTDARSRHYSIGPECEKHWPWMIVQVDEENDGKSFGHL